MKEPTKLQKLDKRLQNHDYTYEMSDDHRDWVSGTRDEEEIRELIKECEEQYGLTAVQHRIKKHKPSGVGTNFLEEEK